MTDTDQTAQTATGALAAPDYERCFAQAHYGLTNGDPYMVTCLDHLAASLTAFLSGNGLTGATIFALVRNHRCDYRFDTPAASAEAAPETWPEATLTDKKCMKCGMIATRDPQFHQDRYEHAPQVQDGPGVLTWSSDILGWIAEPVAATAPYVPSGVTASGYAAHEFTDDGSDPGNCAICHFFHTDKRGPDGKHTE
jgi:hypothetical protein